jgi:DNA (cytosine-5)-methyltransferase 1
MFVQKNFLSVVDLFAGCGGFGLGLEQAGFTPIYVNELNDDARRTYIVNRMHRHEWFAMDLDEQSWLNPFSSSDARRITKKEHIQKIQQLFRSEFGVGEGEIDPAVPRLFGYRPPALLRRGQGGPPVEPPLQGYGAYRGPAPAACIRV